MKIVCKERRAKHSKGYWLIYRPTHPHASGSGYIPEHRLIIENILGEYPNPLTTDVHHKDANVKNNNINNLQLVTKKEHRRFHAGWQIIDGEWWKTCTGCGAFLKVEGNFYKRKVGHNEYVTRCKQCVRKKSHTSRKGGMPSKSDVVGVA